MKVNMSQYPITQTCLTPALKAQIYQAFAKHAMDSVGFDGLALDPVVFEVTENDVSLGVCVC
jgi:hypothetical protein